MDAGIYAIYNTVNDKLYIGSAVSLRQRFHQHKSALRLGKHHSAHLQSAWATHGEAAFDFSCLEAVPRKELLVEREQAWLDALRPWDRIRGYNASQTAGSTFGIKLSAAARANMSRANMGKVLSDVTRARISLGLMGRPVSDAQRAKMRLAKTGQKHSEESKAKISASKTGKKMPPRSVAHRAKLSLAARNRSAETRAKLSAAMKRFRQSQRMGSLLPC